MPNFLSQRRISIPSFELLINANFKRRACENLPYEQSLFNGVRVTLRSLNFREKES
jgi:hypothetical protein